LWAAHEKEQEELRQGGENKRLLAKEHAANMRAEVAGHTKIQDTTLRNDESWREALLDAQTDLELGKDSPPYNDFNPE
jgi:hypothetical protein